jgi:fructose-bisphosphate aldolase class II
MPIATPEVYAEMLGRAKEHSFAFPAINCVGSESVNAAIKGFADAGSDGIIQFSRAERNSRPAWESRRW